MGKIIRKIKTSVCKTCGKVFKHRTDHPTIYCSRSCYGISIRVIQKPCILCGKSVRSKRNTFCSNSCRDKARREKTVKRIYCTYCGKRFNRHQCHIKIRNYCSVNCRNMSYRLPIGHISILYNNGYFRKRIKIKQPDKMILNARYVWEKYNGSQPKGTVIHHKDGNTLNDDISNLQLMNRDIHSKYHRHKKLNCLEPEINYSYKSDGVL